MFLKSIIIQVSEGPCLYDVMVNKGDISTRLLSCSHSWFLVGNEKKERVAF